MSFAKVGSELFVNTTTAGEQYGSSVTQLVNGDIAVAWTDVNGSAVNVRGQILNADGVTKDGAEFMLNTTLTGDQFDVSVTALGNGGFAAGWTSSADLPSGAPFDLDNSGVQNHVVTQVYSSVGAKIGDERTHFLDDNDYPWGFNGINEHYQSAATLTANVDENGDDFDLFFVEELYDYAGSWIPPIEYLNYEAGHNNIAVFWSGGAEDFLIPADQDVTWDWDDQWSVFSPIHPADFAELDRFHAPKAITLTDGTVVTAYSREANASSLGGVHIDIGGQAGTVRVGSGVGGSPALSELDNGNFVVVWTDTVNSTDGATDIRGQILSPTSVKVGGEFAVSNLAGSQWAPAVAGLADGRFVAVWQDWSGSGGDASGSSIKAQIFTAAGVKSGAEFLVNTVVDDIQFEPTVTALADGKFIVTWTSADGATDDIKSQVFDPRDYTGDSADDTVYGGDDDDELDGGEGTDTLHGGGGNDLFENVTSDDFTDGDIFDGGDGIDTIDFDDPILSLGGPPVLLGANSTITGVEIFNLDDGLANSIELAIPLANSSSTGNITVNGGTGLDIIDGRRVANADVSLFLNGNGDNDTLQGGSGDDTLSGGEGGDSMQGGAGNDLYVVDSVDDTVTEGPSPFVTTSDLVIALIDYSLGPNLEHLALGEGDSHRGTGNNLGNDIVGNSNNNTLSGLGSNDHLYGEDGNDELDGGTGADIMEGGENRDTYVIDNAFDVVLEAANEGVDTLNASVTYVLAAGQSVETLQTVDAAATTAMNLTGNELGNTIIGNDGTNFLVGGGGVDTLTGNGGNDSFLVDNAADVVVELAGDGIDNVNASVDYTLAAGVSSETLRTDNAAGVAAIDLTGNEINNFVTGNAGANILNGGLGSDTLTGNGDNDTFVFNTVLNAATNVDSIVDFVVVNDTIQLENAIFTGLAAGTLAATAFRIGSAAADADDRIIYDNNTGALRFDSDGTGANAAIQFATLATGLAPNNNDFVVV